MRRQAVLLWIGCLGPAGAAQTSRPLPVILGFPSSVQTAGLSGAGVALPGYAGALFVNPAGLATIRVLSLEGGFSRTPDHSTYAMAAAATRLGKLNVGVGSRYLLFPSSSPIVDNLNTSVALVYRFGSISFGGSAKYISLEERNGPTTRSLTSDLAMQLAVFDIAALAISVQNVGQARLTGNGLSLPDALHFGFSLNLLDTYSNGRLLATVETVWSEGEHGRTVLGLEAGAVVSGLGIVGRVGSGKQPGLAGGLLSATTFGASVLLGRARLDYAYQKRSALGKSVHLAGVRWTP